jgi:hypothetical protein
MIKSLLICVLMLIGSLARADQQQKIRFFFSCSSCDFDFVRTQLTYVDYVRDPADADVHGYVVREDAANGGSRYTFTFLGRKTFEGANDTLQFTKKESDTQDDFRMSVIRTLSLGLARYVSHSAEAERLDIVYKPADTVTQDTHDPWDSWVFSTDANVYLYGVQTHGTYNYWGSANANRITPELKMRFGADVSYYEDRFKDLDITSISRSMSFNALVVKSLGEHWSVGPRFIASSSTSVNRQYRFEEEASVEYDLFPYSESTARQFRILYGLGLSEVRYFEETIYDKLKETLPSHVLSASIVFQQPWGSVETTLAGSQYLSDLTKTELNAYLSLQLRLFEGLSVRFSGNYASIHDQLFLPKSGLTEEEILLQRQQLATDYSFYTVVGLTYTFGSIFNNVVNPRFGN